MQANTLKSIAKRERELCGVEFQSAQDLRDFKRRNPEYLRYPALTNGQSLVVLFYCRDYPTRDIEEIYNSDGSLYAIFIGPDALKDTYQIMLV